MGWWRVVAGVLVVGGALAGCRGAAPPGRSLPPVSGGPLLLPPAVAPTVPDEQTVVDRVVAVVNDEVILMSELQEAMGLYLRDTREPPPSGEKLIEVQQKVLSRMIDLRLQIQEARREKIEITDDEVQQLVDDFVRKNGGDRERIGQQLKAQGLSWEQVRRELRDSLLAQKIRSRRVARRISVSEAEVDAYVAANRSKFEADLKYHPEHLVVLAQPPDSPAAWTRAETEVQKIEARLRDGAEFGDLVREYSRAGSTGAGDLGWVARGELQPVFEEVILKLQPGGVTPPIKSADGFHLFRLAERQALTPELLAQLREQARDLLLQRKAQERFDEWVQGLRQRALIAERL